MRKSIKRFRYKNKTIKKIRGGAIRTGYYHYSHTKLDKNDFKNISNNFIKQNLTKDNFNYNNNNINQKNNIQNKTFSEMLTGMKPGGLWLSKGNEWAETSAFKGGKYIYEVSIDDSNMIILDTIDKVKDFTDKYKIDINSFFIIINWKKVAREYDGIIFDNYNKIKKEILKEINPKYMWFSTVDINSACTWRPIKTIIKWIPIK